MRSMTTDSIRLEARFDEERGRTVLYDADTETVVGTVDRENYEGEDDDA